MMPSLRPLPSSRSRARLGQLLPAHRLALVAKTPLLAMLGLHVAGGRFAVGTVGLSVLLASALWTSLYALNEATDLALERGIVVEARTRRLLYGLPAAVCLLAFPISSHLGLLLTMMALGQAAYAVPPFRLKRTGWAIYLLGGVVNPVLRLQCGAMWGIHAVPLSIYLWVIALHLGAALRSRELLRERDRRLGYRPAPHCSEALGRACTGAGLLGAFLLCARGTLPPPFWPLTVLATGYAVHALSGRVTHRSQIRKDWIWFAAFSVSAIAALRG
jgi:hypothetical protein